MKVINEMQISVEMSKETEMKDDDEVTIRGYKVLDDGTLITDCEIGQESKFIIKVDTQK